MLKHNEVRESSGVGLLRKLSNLGGTIGNMLTNKPLPPPSGEETGGDTSTTESATPSPPLLPGKKRPKKQTGTATGMSRV
jgi:hypothetical protein